MVPKSDQNRSIKSECRGRPRSEESEVAILDATIQLLSKRPLRDISMEEIARKAGVGKATIYKWWPSKAYVALDAFLRKTNRMVPTPDTGSVRRDILEQLRSVMVFYRSPAGHILGQFVAESQADKEFAALFRERFLKPRREAIGVIWWRPKWQLLSWDTQKNGVSHREDLASSKLIVHVHIPDRVIHHRGRDLEHFHVRIRVGDKCSYGVVRLLHWNAEPERR